MKKLYEAPMVEKITFRYRDQVVAASGGGPDEQSIDETGNIFESNQLGSCYSFEEGFDYALGALLGDCDWW